MTIYTNTPYTYRISWSKTGMNYYGVRYAKKCHPGEFWVKYFTTSNYVTEYRKVHGEPDIIEIRKQFLTENRVNDARQLEHRVLKKLDVVVNPNYLNMSDGKGIDPRLSSRARTGVSPASKGKPLPESTKNKMRKPKEIVTCPHCGKSGGISAMYRHHFDNCGKKIANFILNKLRNSNTEKSSRAIVNEIRELRSLLTRDQLKKVSVEFGRGWYQLTDEILKPLLGVLKLEVPLIIKNTTRKNMRGVNQQKITCPHCSKNGGISLMKRHHFDNCKNLLFINPECFESGEP